MQAYQDHKEGTQNRFSQIDQRWTRVEDAIRVQAKERSADITELQQNLNKYGKTSQSLQNKKIQLTDRKLLDLGADAEQTKENLEQLFETEASFRLQSLEDKNIFIQQYTQNGNAFNKNLQQYLTSRMGDLGKKLEAVDAANRAKTQQDVKELKEEMIGQAKEFFNKQKERYGQMLSKISEDSSKKIDDLRGYLRACQKERQEGQAKLKMMIQGVSEELSKMCDYEQKEGEATYDSLLKVLEESCDRIQHSQLR